MKSQGRTSSAPRSLIYSSTLRPQSLIACFQMSQLKLSVHILRRAGITVNYSQGFNPHALFYFSPPLGVGVSSVAEYLTIDTDMNADEVFERYNSAVPDTLRASGIFVCPKNPNLQGKVVSADYILNFASIFKNSF